SQPATTQSAAVTDTSTPEPTPDYTGAFQATPNSVSVPGYTPPKDAANPTPDELKQVPANVAAVASRASANFYSINYVWTLVAGFLVMFMQAGFALVETGLARAKNAAHTMSMNFLVYALGMTGFFICGFAFMCGGANKSPIGGPGVLGGVPVLNQGFTVGDGWLIAGKTGFFLSGKT